tara:strand:- start:3995 stop:4957 length:963 start_codon:yes stop_codon:yes gene_type:complete
MATSSTYCTHRDLKDIYPNLDEFDAKTAIYGWIEVTSNKYAAHNSGLVTQLFADGEDLGPAQSAHTDLNVEGEWFYNSAEDICYYYSASTPLDKLMEAGEEFSTLITRIMKNASRYVDSRVDAGIPRDAFKDKEGNYDYFLVRTSSLVSVYFLINAHTPGSDVAEKFLEEANFNIDQINTGKTKLSYQVTGDSAGGVVREVTSPQAANALYIVDTRGRYTGVYDLMKIVITTAGAIGTCKFDVYHGDDTGLKQNRVVEAELITGQYQSIGGGLQVRFSGKNSSSVATVNDEWELECWGQYESLDDSPGSGTNTRLTRRTY